MSTASSCTSSREALTGSERPSQDAGARLHLANQHLSLVMMNDQHALSPSASCGVAWPKHSRRRPLGFDQVIRAAGLSSQR